jgi:hypothetical protein
MIKHHEAITDRRSYGTVGHSETLPAAAFVIRPLSLPALTPAASIHSTLRQQALDELLNDLAEYHAASHPALRAFWRKLAMHDIRRFRRDYLIPERAAFEAAVERAKRRHAA